MNRFRRLTIAVSLSLALVSVPAMALAETQVTYAIVGVELPGATPTVGSFAGVAVALAPFDYGTWRATIVHDATTICPPLTDFTPCGGFALDGKIRDVQGVFTGGSLTQTGFSDCGKETFTVVGELALVGPTEGTGLFRATLTHYRKLLSAGCTTYFATVKGWVTFSL